jgi:hypothetical protein
MNVSGSRYKNTVFQQFYLNTNPYSVTFSGVLGGTATLVSFDYSWDDPFQFWKLFYSNNRARAFRFNSGLREISNYPETSDYQSATLPYTNILVDENPTDYPLTVLESQIQYANKGYSNDVWTRIADNQFTFRTMGRIIFSTPANDESTTPVDTIDEQYSISGTTYARDAENRGEKDLPLYQPNGTGVKLRLLLCYNNFFENSSTQTFKV